MSGGDIIEVLQIAPPRKHCHSIAIFPLLDIYFVWDKEGFNNYLCVTFPLLPFSSRTSSVNTHKCFPSHQNAGYHMNMLGRDRKIENPRGSAVLVAQGKFEPIF